MKKIGAFTIDYPHMKNRLESDLTVFDGNGKPSSDRSEKKWRALWDTGATMSCISQRIADELQLQPLQIIKVYSATNEVLAITYYVGLLLPNHFTTKVIAAGVPRMSDDVDIVIGMDVISKGDFAVTNVNRKTSFSFRIPSKKRIDYMQEPLMDD